MSYSRPTLDGLFDRFGAERNFLQFGQYLNLISLGLWEEYRQL